MEPKAHREKPKRKLSGGVVSLSHTAGVGIFLKEGKAEKPNYFRNDH